MTHHHTTDPQRGADGGAGLIERLEHLAECGSGWCDEATFAHVMAVAIAAERRRQARGESEAAYRWNLNEAIRAEDAALAALQQHLLGTTTTAQDGPERGADGA